MATRRVRIVFWTIGILVLITMMLSATVAIVIFKSLSTTGAAPAAAEQAFTEIRNRYPDRAPLIEIPGRDPREARINRTPNASRKSVDTIHFMYWDPEDQQIVRGEAPTWITNLRVSLTGVGNFSFSDFHITREDIERYSPGVLVDYKSPEGARALAWTQ